MKINLLFDKKIFVFPVILLVLFLLLLIVDSAVVPKIEQLNCDVLNYIESTSVYEKNLTEQLKTANETFQKELNLKLDRLFYDRLEFIKKKKTETEKKLGGFAFISDNFDGFAAVHFAASRLDPFFPQPCVTAELFSTSCITYSNEACIKDLMGIETKKLSGLNLLFSVFYLMIVGYLLSFIYFYCLDAYKGSKRKIKVKKRNKKTKKSRK